MDTTTQDVTAEDVLTFLGTTEATTSTVEARLAVQKQAVHAYTRLQPRHRPPHRRPARRHHLRHRPRPRQPRLPRVHDGRPLPAHLRPQHGRLDAAGTGRAQPLASARPLDRRQRCIHAPKVARQPIGERAPAFWSVAVDLPAPEGPRSRFRGLRFSHASRPPVASLCGYGNRLQAAAVSPSWRWRSAGLPARTPLGRKAPERPAGCVSR